MGNPWWQPTVGLAGAAQPWWAKARSKSQGMRSRICLGQTLHYLNHLLCTSAKVPPANGSKMPFPKHSLLLQLLLTLHFQGKKRGIKLAIEVKTPSVILQEQEGRSRSNPPGTAMQRGPTGVCPSLINTNYHPWHSADSPCGKKSSKGGLGCCFPSFPFLWCWWVQKQPHSFWGAPTPAWGKGDVCA